MPVLMERGASVSWEHFDKNRGFKIYQGGQDSLCLENPRDVSLTYTVLQGDQIEKSITGAIFSVIFTITLIAHHF